MTADTRLYIIAAKEAGPDAGRLVEASSRAQAIRHVAEDTLTCRVAGALDVARLMGCGVSVEQARERSIGADANDPRS